MTDALTCIYGGWGLGMQVSCSRSYQMTHRRPPSTRRGSTDLPGFRM